MKKRVLLFVAVIASVYIPGLLQGQNNLKYCGTQEWHNEYVKTHPEVLEIEKQKEAYNEQRNKLAGKSQGAGPVYIIPVVFHIIHEYGAENISEAQIMDQMEILNRDFRKLNADTVDVVNSFKSIVADAEIEFRLATLDPQGNCTNGIDRIYSMQTNVGSNTSKLNQWDRAKYLNIWVVKTISSGAAGYSQYPSAVTSNAAIDGVMILHDYIGSIGTSDLGRSRALTHEIGHYLDLQHVWGSTNQPGVACGNDFVADTPITKGWTTCNLTGAICSPTITENVQNYMEYAYCSRMFTEGQKTRMRNALTNTAQYPFRANLWSTSNLAATGALANPVPTCIPTADLNSNTIFLCAGNSYTFTDASYKGTPTSWSWTFAGGTPSTSTDQNPTIQFNTAGVYDVSLTVGNSAGSATVNRPSLVVVSNNPGTYGVPFFEDFENFNYPGNDWFIENPYNGNAWQKTSNASHWGSNSIYKSNFSGNPTGTDAFITTSFNLTNIFAATASFYYAFAVKSNPQAPATVKDKLVVYSSSDCGQTWTQRYLKTGITLSTAGIISSSSFTPNFGQWAQQIIPLGSTQVSNKPNIRLKFEYTYDVGNNIYIDDIFINGTAGIDDAQAEQLNLSVMPNPSSATPTVSFTLLKPQPVSVYVTDVLGRVVDQVDEKLMEEGNHQFQLKAGLKPGVYFIQLYLGNNFVTEKAVIE